MILYAILRILCWLTLPIYYKRVRVAGKEHRIEKGPLIVVSNHPNTMMDAILVGMPLRQRLGFLANASIFKNPIAARIWRYLRVIPIYRQQDLAAGERMDNAESFRECFAFLKEGHSLMILPEGTSYSEMKLRPIKSGVARIALEFQNRYGKEFNLRILPVSLNYSDPTRFRSNVLVRFGNPIELDHFEDLYNSTPRRAVRQLTGVIKDRLAENMVILDDKEREEVFGFARVLLSDQVRKTETKALSPELELDQLQSLSAGIQRLADKDHSSFSDLLEKGRTYFREMDRLGLRDGQFKAKRSSWWPEAILSTAILIIFFPIFLVGSLLNGPVLLIPAFVVPRLTEEIEYHAIMKLILSWIVFPIWYLAWSISFYHLSGLPEWWTWVLIGSAPLLGLLGWGWYKIFLKSRAYWNWGIKKSKVSQLWSTRADVMEKLNQLITVEEEE